MSKKARLKAQKIFEALCFGTPPPENIEQFTVGRQKEVEYLERAMMSASEGDPRIIFIRGDYGAGKSHLLSLFQQRALKKGFCTAYVVLDSREQPLHNLSKIYKKVAFSLRSPQKEALTFGDLFQECAERMLDRVQDSLDERCKHGLTFRTCARLCLGDELLKNHFPVLSEQDYSISSVIKILVWSIMRKEECLTELARRWLCGDNLTKSECKSLIFKIDSPLIQIPLSIDERDIIKVFLSISSVIDLSGYRGIAILFDESEAIPSTGRWRDTVEAYENLLKIIIQSTHKKGRIIFIYATTPTFYEDIDSNFYSFLRSRGDGYIADFMERNILSNTIELRLLYEDELITLAKLIAQVYFQSRDKKMTEKMWQNLVPKAKKVFKEVEDDPTWTVRQFVVRWCSSLRKAELGLKT